MEPRALRPVPDPLGSYVRPGRDVKALTQLLAEGQPIGTGLVADPCLKDRQQDLLEEAGRRGVETVLDPRTLELSTPGGFVRRGVAELPWARPRPHVPTDLTGPSGALAVRQIVSAVESGRYSAVLAPTHFLRDLQDPWLDVDAELTRTLRRELDSRQLRAVPIYYPVMLKAEIVRGSAQQTALMAALQGLPIDALWLRVHPFGTTGSGPLALRRYLQLCRALHDLHIPLVAEHSGTVGVALLAFGAVGGIESGITVTETVSFDAFLKAPDPTSRPFAPPPRVYLHQIGAFLNPKRADAFFAARGMKSTHGCQDACCSRGWRDMQLDPRRHFIRQRAREVGALSAVPESLRAGHYLENHLRPASDRALRTAEVEPTLASARLRLDSWRGTLGEDLTSRSPFTISAPAAGKRLRRSA